LPRLLKILVDGRYKQGAIKWGKALFGYLLEVVKRSDAKGFNVLPKRWIVARTFGRFLWQRRLARDYAHNPQSSEAMSHFTAATLRLRRLTL
jgi:transposase